MLAEYRDTIYHCLKCGACRHAYGVYEPICPSGMKYGFDSYYAIGRVSLARAVMNKEVEIDAELMRRVYTCTSCGACDEQCHEAVGVDPLQIIEELKFEAVESGMIPPEVRDYLKRMNVNGNPYQLPQQERGLWAQAAGVPLYDGQEYLFYVGDVGSYDERGSKMAAAVAGQLMAAGVELGVLGPLEMSDGNEVNRVGERGLFEYLAQANIEQFKELGVKKIITLSPHAYHAFKNDYPQWGGEFEVMHYSQALAALMEKGAWQPGAAETGRVAFHDPCFLGRHNNEYEAPRRVLAGLGLELVEMVRNRESALCCGGGGGNFFTDLLGAGPLSPARARVREAAEAGAQIIATACPKCFNMLDDAIKAENLDDSLKVRDLAQLV